MKKVSQVSPSATSGGISLPGGEWSVGVFGYGSIQDHMDWRKHPEHPMQKSKATRVEDGGAGDPSMVPAEVPGIDRETGYFHVESKELR